MMSEPPRAPTLADWGELRLLRWLRRTCLNDPLPPGVALPIGMGDDAAHLRLSAGRDLIVTADALIEGSHFRRNWIAPRDLGARSLVASLSDLAAMGASPLAAFLCFGAPAGALVRDVKAFFLSLRDCGRRWACPLAGGDLVRAPQWTIAVTLLGRPAWRGRVLRRSAARPGQVLYVTGAPGESGAGLLAIERGVRAPKLIARHRRPTPRLAEAAVIARLCRDAAAIDISDGLFHDAGHLARESGAGIEIDLESIPLSRALRAAAPRLDLDPVDAALHGGEDFELLFTTATGLDRLRGALDSAGCRTPVTAIGRVVEGRGVALLDSAGRPVKRMNRTFTHFA